MRSRGLAAAVVGTCLLGSAVPASGADTGPVAPVADTTFTQVSADGDNSTKTTLATCPQLCDGNADGRRDAVLEFGVTGVPAGARVTRAVLELYSWNAYAATVTAYAATGTAADPGTWAARPALGGALATRTAVTAGYNAFDVTAAVTGNGTKTFALLQETYNTRVYWASKENASAAIRPRLTVTYGAPGGDWQLVWEDNFDGPTLDTAKWTARPLDYLDFDKACITDRPQNVFVSGGNLTLRAQRERLTCWSETNDYTTAYLDTIGKATFGYGRFETRAKSPGTPTGSKGLWPAFWLRRSSVAGGGDPNDGNGELDVMELPGGAQYYDRSTTAVFQKYSPQVKNDYRVPWPAGTYPGDGFHVYAAEWEPGVIRFYVDDRLVWTVDPTNTPWFGDVFNGDARYHLRLTFHVGGWLGDPDATTLLPADFVVDYVRVYQR
ncbi:hypothetical protein Val02_01680 [Virgisporangium aliadipatigenens]|uniref:GH16 domain-containing protein n=1 Tax=Virgisporangium aliadipatigenens TaxID=741659 RepID=A0A8J3YFF5_9ACTN|nr:glycoside hydrolase family 16 protein [Virgisporangium aliadipatigenens]GIJ43282.1 hypothetical protein Val02_01680 [Virgisporangium aliadipatigenens]